MPKEIFFTTQELELRDDKSPEVKKSLGFDFKRIAEGYSADVKYIRHDIFPIQGNKLQLVITFEKDNKASEEKKPLMANPVRKFKLPK